eukprot:Rmarinus@m.27999
MEWSTRVSRRCPVCTKGSAKFLCVACFDQKSGEWRSAMTAVEEKSDVYVGEMHEHLFRRERFLEQERVRAHFVQRKEAIANQVRSMAGAIKQLRDMRDAKHENIALRKKRLEEAWALLKEKRKTEVKTVLEPLLQTLSWHVVVVSEVLSEERCRLIKQVFSLVRASREDGGRRCSIVDLTLPNSHDYSNIPIETSSVALGYIVFALQMISSYLNIPLANKVVFNSAGSYVKDVSLRSYPLFIRPNESTRGFKRGLALLDQNIAQLAYVQGRGIPREKRKETLLNLFKIRTMSGLGIPPALLARMVGFPKIHEQVTAPLRPDPTACYRDLMNSVVRVDDNYCSHPTPTTDPSPTASARDIREDSLNDSHDPHGDWHFVDGT